MSAPSPLQSLLGSRFIQLPDRLRAYETPERGTPGRAACLMLPETSDEVGQILRICNEIGQRIVISAGRTGLVEAQRPEGEAVLSLERLQRPLFLELASGERHDFMPHARPEQQADALLAWWEQRGRPATGGATVTVEAGLPVDTLNLILAPLRLMFPMEMGSSAAASVGACVANASAGANAVCYGTAAHMCRQAWGFWGSGAPAGPCRSAAWRPADPQRLAINSAGLRPEWGLIGSQGVLGVITRVELQTYPVPAQREAVLLPASGMPAAMVVLEAARRAFPDSVEEFEFISQTALDLVRRLHGAGFRSPLSRLEAPYYLLLQVKSGDAGEDLAARLYEFVSTQLQYADDDIGYAPLKDLKNIRHSITEASNLRMRELGGGRLAFDTATPVALFGEYLTALEDALRAASPGAQLVAFGHAGVGGAHLHVLGTADHPISRHGAELTELVFDVTARFEGTFSAEHGVGTKWGGQFARRVPPETLAALLAAKRERDPKGVLHPRSFGLDRLLS